MAAPTVAVSLDFSGSNFGTAFSGTDVTAVSVAGWSYSPITITWGRQDQYTVVQPTSVSSIFLDSTGDFTPGKTGGAHYPRIRRNLHRRIAVTANATTVPVSADFATTLTVVPTTDMWTTQIDGQDLLARYSGTQSTDDPTQAIAGTTLRSFLAEETLLDNPTAFYMLQESDGSTTFADVTTLNANGSVGTSKLGGGSVTAGQSVNGNYIAGTAVTVANPAPSNASQQIGSYISLPINASIFEFWVSMPTASPSSTAPSTLLSQYAADSSGMLLQLDAVTGDLDLLVFGSGSNVPNTYNIPLDGGMHQIYVVINATNTSAAVYVDGSLRMQGTASSFTRGTPISISLGATVATYVGSMNLDQAFSGSFAYFSSYSSALATGSTTLTSGLTSGTTYTTLSVAAIGATWNAGTPVQLGTGNFAILSSAASSGATTLNVTGFTADQTYASGSAVTPHNSTNRVYQHYIAGALGFTETTDQRVSRLLTYRPDYGAVLDTGYGTIGNQDIQGRSLADVLLEVGQAEGGALFIDGQDQVNFRSRSRLFNPTVAMTLDCSAGSVMFGGNFRDDTQNVLNDVTISGVSGANQRYYSSSSIALDGEFSTSLALPIAYDSEALEAAGWLVSNGTQENLVVDGLMVNLLTCSAAVAAQVLALKPLDCIAVTNIDVNSSRAPSSSMSFVVQGGVLTLGMDEMTAQLNVTPLPLTVVQVGGDAAHGVASSAIIGY